MDRRGRQTPPRRRCHQRSKLESHRRAQVSGAICHRHQKQVCLPRIRTAIYHADDFCTRYVILERRRRQALAGHNPFRRGLEALPAFNSPSERTLSPPSDNDDGFDFSTGDCDSFGELQAALGDYGTQNPALFSLADEGIDFALTYLPEGTRAAAASCSSSCSSSPKPSSTCPSVTHTAPASAHTPVFTPSSVDSFPYIPCLPSQTPLPASHALLQPATAGITSTIGSLWNAPKSSMSATDSPLAATVVAGADNDNDNDNDQIMLDTHAWPAAPMPVQEWSIGGCQNEQSPHSATTEGGPKKVPKTMLVLEDVQIETVNALVAMLLTSRRQVKMRLYTVQE